MTSPEPPIERSPIGESPKWIAWHAFVGFGSLPVLGFITLPFRPEHQWTFFSALTVVILLLLANFARMYAPRRYEMTKTETSYLRFALLIIAGAGVTGTWHLSIPAGVAFLVWTIVVRRRQKQRTRDYLAMRSETDASEWKREQD